MHNDAVALGSDGQLLLGGVGTFLRDATGAWQEGGALAARLYLGSNGIKALLEVERRWGADRQASFLRGGVEVHPPVGGWLTLAAGLKEGDGVEGRALVVDVQYSLDVQYLLGRLN